MLDFLGKVNVINSPNDCDVISLGEDGLRFKKEHAYPGKFRMKSSEGPVDFEFTEDSLKVIAAETQRYVENGNKSNLPTHHTDDTEANRGHNVKWFTELDSKGRLGLFSEIEFRDAKSAELAKTAQTSLYLPPVYEDGAKNKYVRPALHVALTDRPVLPGLDGFVAIAASLVSNDGISKKELSMPIKDLVESIGLKLSEDALTDETKISEAIVASFTSERNKAEALSLELSEYKKLNPPKVDPVKVSKTQVAMLRENRELKLSQLVEAGKILPCVAEELKTVFCGEATLSLCLSEDKEDNFGAVIAALKENDSIKLSELSGPQVDYARLTNVETNPMLKNAAKRAAALGR